MKLYCLTNMYCNAVQAGIQAAHAGIRLVKEYENDTVSHSYYSSMIDTWYDTSETLVVLNAGDHNALTEHYDTLLKQARLPYAKFNEVGLNDALTSIAVLCTEKMVSDMKVMRENDTMKELQLMDEYDAHTYTILKAISQMRTM